MEEKPEGTPNPLNPNLEAEALDANPSEEMGAESLETAVESAAAESVQVSFAAKPANPGRPVDPMIPVNNKPLAAELDARPAATVEPVGGISEPEVENSAATFEAATMGVVTDMNGAPIDNSDPMNRPMQKAVDEVPKEPKKKNKKGLIISAIICAVLALGCGVAAAIVMLTGGRDDAVAKAFLRLISGEAPTNLAIDGTIDISSNDATSDITDMQISLTTEMIMKSMINQTTARINANTRSGQSFQMELGEVYAANGDLYIKIDGLARMMDGEPGTLEGEAAPELPEGEAPEGMPEGVLDEPTDCSPEDDNCLEPEEGGAAMILGMLQTLGSVDGEWIRISTDSLSSSEGGMVDSDTSCMVNFAKDLKDNSNSLLGFYNKNPFIMSTTENLPVVAEKNPIYQVIIDSDKLVGFLGEAKNNAAIQNFATCTGTDASEVDEMAIKSDLAEMPAFYVEIDGDYNFTRFYMDTDDGETSAKIDLDFSYPTNVNVPEPSEYKDFETVLQEMFMGMFDFGGLDEGEVVETAPEETPVE